MTAYEISLLVTGFGIAVLLWLRSRHDAKKLDERLSKRREEKRDGDL